jgi:hypothetical protein
MTVWHKLYPHSRKQTSSSSRRRWGARLLLELLEDRCVPATFYVNVNGGSDANPGTAGAPFASIQMAVNIAKQYAIGQRAPQQDNNTIIVAAGTYSGTSQPNDATSLGFPSVVGVVDQQLTILGGYDASFTHLSGASVIDGFGVARGVVVASSIRTTSLTLDGFTIQNGFAGPQTTVPGRLTAFGGGLFIDLGATQTNPTNIIRNVTFQNNTAKGSDNTITDANSGTDTDFGEGVGGGMAAIFANDVLLENNTFVGNRAVGGNGPRRGGTGIGGGLYGGEGTHYRGGNLTFTNNTALAGSSATGGPVTTIFGEEFNGGFGGGVGLLNAGTSIDFSELTATSNVAQGGNGGSAPGNQAGYGRGGGIYSEDGNVNLSDAVLSNNKAATGTANSGAFATAGGGLYATVRSIAGTVNLNRVSILDNEVSDGTVEGGSPGPVLGGGLGTDRIDGQPMTVNITNSVIAGNRITANSTPGQFSGGGGVWDDGATVNIAQTTIADNTIPTSNASGSAILIYDGAINVAYSIIANHNTGTLPAVTGGVPRRTGSINFTGRTLFSNNANNGASGGNIITGDAKFTNAAGGDYSLQAGSAAIDQAVGSGATVDILRRLRVGTPDLGAYEFGTHTTPVAPPPGSFDKLAAFRTTDGAWSLDSNGNRVFDPGDRVLVNFGGAGRVGVVGDWTNSSHDNIGDFSNGQWRLDLDNNGVFDANDWTFYFGQAGDIPIVGNFYGTGTRIGVFRTAPDGFTGEFIIDKNGDGKMDAGDDTFTFGIGTDRIVIGDWGGTGVDKVGVFRSVGDSANTAIFTLDSNNDHAFDGSDAVFRFGIFTDGIVVGNWNGDSRGDKVGVYRAATAYGAPGTAVFTLDNNGNLQFDPGIDQVFLFGNITDTFLAGNWTPTELAASMGAGAAALLPNQIDPIFSEAVRRWAATGLSGDAVAQLSATQVNLADLSGNTVGLADPGVITLSRNAAGNGWYVDPTPQSDAEFADPNGPQAGKMDLLTVIEHELGHELGRPDDTSGGLMDGVLPTGTRRSP